MSGETESDESGWTVDTLKYHIDAQMVLLRTLLDERDQTQRREVGAALQSAEKAVTKAEGAAEKRFEAVNEFRGQLADQAGTFMTRVEAESIQLRNAERIQDLTDRLNRAEGAHTGSTATVGLLLAAVTVALSVVIVVVNVVLK